MSKTIVYVPHPVSTAEKKAYLKKFDRLIDARYAPKKLNDGDKLVKDKSEPKVKVKVKE